MLHSTINKNNSQYNWMPSPLPPPSQVWCWPWPWREAGCCGEILPSFPRAVVWGNERLDLIDDFMLFCVLLSHSPCIYKPPQHQKHYLGKEMLWQFHFVVIELRDVWLTFPTSIWVQIALFRPRHLRLQYHLAITYIITTNYARFNDRARAHTCWHSCDISHLCLFFLLLFLIILY